MKHTPLNAGPCLACVEMLKARLVTVEEAAAALRKAITAMLDGGKG